MAHNHKPKPSLPSPHKHFSLTLTRKTKKQATHKNPHEIHQKRNLPIAEFIKNSPVTSLIIILADDCAFLKLYN
jgi:hypothetical protein